MSRPSQNILGGQGKETLSQEHHVFTVVQLSNAT